MSAFTHCFCPSVCLSVCRQSVFTKMQFSQKLSNWQLWSLWHITSSTKAFQGTHYWASKIQGGRDPPSWKSWNCHVLNEQIIRFWWGVTDKRPPAANKIENKIALHILHKSNSAEYIVLCDFLLLLDQICCLRLLWSSEITFFNTTCKLYLN